MIPLKALVEERLKGVVLLKINKKDKAFPVRTYNVG